MIVNYNKKFFFVHIQKTAGTSITDILKTISGSEQFHYPHTLMKHISLTDTQKDLFKFAFVRNPWDRLYSWYNMCLYNGPINKFHSFVLENSNNFSEFLDCIDIVIDDVEVFNTSITNYKSISFNQLDYVSDERGNILTDYIGRFENINEDFQFICNKLNLGNLELPHKNKFVHSDYREQYTDSAIEKVYNMYKRDIEYFGYRF